MKAAALEAKAALAGAKLAKVLSRLGDNIGTEFHDNAASGLAANGHIEKDLGFGPVCVSCVVLCELVIGYGY